MIFLIVLRKLISTNSFYLLLYLASLVTPVRGLPIDLDIIISSIILRTYSRYLWFFHRHLIKILIESKSAPQRSARVNLSWEHTITIYYVHKYVRTYPVLIQMFSATYYLETQSWVKWRNDDDQRRINNENRDS